MTPDAGHIQGGDPTGRTFSRSREANASAPLVQALLDSGDAKVALVSDEGHVLENSRMWSSLVGHEREGGGEGPEEPRIENVVRPEDAERVHMLLEESATYGRTAGTVRLRDDRLAALRLDRVGDIEPPMHVARIEPQEIASTVRAETDREERIALAILETARASARARDPDDLCRRAARAFFDVYPAPIVVIHTLDPTENALSLVAAEGNARPWLERRWILPLVPMSPSLLVQAALQKRTLVKDRLEMVRHFDRFEPSPAGDVTPGEVMAAFAHLGIRSVADVPIMHEEEVLGVLGIGSTSEEVSEPAVRLLELLAQEIASGLHRLRLEETRERLLAEAREANEELARFTYNVSHDLSEEMRRVATLARMLASDYATELSDEARELAGRVRELTESLQERVRGSLELARVLRVAPLRKSAVELGDLVESAVDRLRTASRERQKFVADVDSSLPRATIDPETFSLALDHILENAIRFNPAPRAKVWVRGRETAEAVVLEIEDDGPGIPEDLREHVLQPFRTAPSAKERAGAGIGLAVVDRVISAHGGSLAIEDREEGHGARIVISLPRE